jgi:hypothetical protein
MGNSIEAFCLLSFAGILAGELPDGFSGGCPLIFEDVAQWFSSGLPDALPIEFPIGF